MERLIGGVYCHESFNLLHSEKGSGYYFFTQRVGMGGIFYLNSKGAIPYSPKDTGPDISVHDIYDVLRAVEEGRVTRLVKVNPMIKRGYDGN